MLMVGSSNPHMTYHQTQATHARILKVYHIYSIKVPTDTTIYVIKHVVVNYDCRGQGRGDGCT